MHNDRPDSPSRVQILLRGVRGACAVCGKWRLTKNWLTVSDKCERCEFPIERKEGHFVGAVGVNTMVTFSVALIGVLLSLLVSGEEYSPTRVTIILGVIVGSFGVFFYPISRTLWSAMDLVMVPLEPGEVDPRFDPTITVEL